MTLESGLKKLKSKGKISNLFIKGKMFGFGNLVMHYHCPKEEKGKMYMGVGVSKRFLTKAFLRNRIKRQIRALIKKKHNYILQLLPFGSYMILYNGKHLSDFKDLSYDFEGLLKLFSDLNHNT